MVLTRSMKKKQELEEVLSRSRCFPQKPEKQNIQIWDDKQYLYQEYNQKILELLEKCKTVEMNEKLEIIYIIYTYHRLLLFHCRNILSNKFKKTIYNKAFQLIEEIKDEIMKNSELEKYNYVVVSLKECCDMMEKMLTKSEYLSF